VRTIEPLTRAGQDTRRSVTRSPVCTSAEVRNSLRRPISGGMGPSDRIAAENALAEVAATRLRVEQGAPIGRWVGHDHHLLRDVNAIVKRDMDVRVPSLIPRRTLRRTQRRAVRLRFRPIMRTARPTSKAVKAAESAPCSKPNPMSSARANATTAPTTA
jgi:hypothetical protein